MRKVFLKTILLSVIMVLSYTCASFAAGWFNDGGDNWSYLEPDGTLLTSTIRNSGEDRFYLDENGIMVRDYLLEDYNDAVYYFDDTGKMVKNTWVAVEPSQVYNQMENAPTIYLYYFGNNGKAYRSHGGIARKTIDGKKYLFNEGGQMLSGWIDEYGNRYNEYDTESDPFVGYCYFAGDETDGVLREGWTAYEEGSVEDRYYLRQTLWFYFKPGDNKKVQSNATTEFATKIINGKKYAFDDNGVMVEGWDSDTIDANNTNNSIRTKQYFKEDGDDKGRLTKKEWVFAVPSMKQNLDDHDQEIERWFYSLGGGDIVKGLMKKINNKHYIFNNEGIMKTGLCIIEKGTNVYVDCIDAEKTDGKDFIISRHYVSVDKGSASKVYEIFDDNTQSLFYFDEGTDLDDDGNLSFGRRRLGEQKVAFADDDYTFVSKGSGEYEGKQKKKYYQNGLRLRADSALGLGIIFVGYSDGEYAETIDHEPVYNGSTNSWSRADRNHENIKSDYIVLKKISDCVAEGKYPVFLVVDPIGAVIDKRNYVKRDKGNNYWLIGDNGTLVNIYEVPIRRTTVNGVKTWQFKSEKLDSSGTKVKTQWINFGTLDEYGKTCRYSRVNPGEYALNLDETYCVNFRFTDE
ncbi:MAG: hypothetical protein J6P02_06165 [Lachnospiraceae bacterium]|nr:hypothetical protein [Lachnospiraceae bacterium]